MLIINILWVDYFITCPMDHSGVVSDQVKYDDFSEKRPSESFSSLGNPSYAWSLVQVLRALHYKFYYIIINNFSDIFFFAKFLHILPLKFLLQFFCEILTFFRNFCKSDKIWNFHETIHPLLETVCRTLQTLHSCAKISILRSFQSWPPGQARSCSPW